MSATTSKRTTTIVYTGDVAGTQSIAATENLECPAVIEVATLTAGLFATVGAPDGATCATITKPSDSTAQLRLKGVSGDTGFLLHPTEPDSITVAPGGSFVLLATGADVTIRIYWS